MPTGLDYTPNSLYNYEPYISPWVSNGSNQRGWERVFHEVVASYVPILGNTNLRELFPDEIIPERVVAVTQRFEPVNTIFPVVYCGKPDVLVGPNAGATRTMYVQPLYIRESTHISHCEINYRVMPGTCNDPYDPQQQIDKTIQDMVLSHNLTWDVFRAHILLGGIRYTDPRTGVPVSVSSRIPAHNYFQYNQRAGIYGRNEASAFRSIMDPQGLDPSTMGVSWADPYADIINTVIRLKRYCRDTNKSTMTAMYMGPDMRDVLYMNVTIRLAMGGGLLPGLGPNNSALISNTPDMWHAAHIKMNGDTIVSIAGVEVRIVETEYKDPVDGITKRVWPKNKVVFVAEQDVNGTREAIGRTQYCASEEHLGKPGFWTRIQMETQIPAAPGMFVQMGNAGMPYIRFPHRVMQVTVASVEDINTRLGLLGELNFMQ